VNPATALRLGRVSNLPTVLTNAVAASLICGAEVGPGSLLGLSTANACFYVGGMYLNDACDRGIDARERPERPIPSGQVRAATVFACGFGLLALGVTLLSLVGLRRGHALPAMWGGIGLAGAILLYDFWHKGNPLASFVMGACRAGVYVSSSLALTGDVHGPIAIAAGALLLYVVGLTAIAAQETLTRLEAWWPGGFLAAPAIASLLYTGMLETLWLPLTVHLGWTAFALRQLSQRRIGIGVAQLIAGISLIDGLLVSSLWVRSSLAAVGVTAVALIALVLTRRLQAHVPGT